MKPTSAQIDAAAAVIREHGPYPHAGDDVFRQCAEEALIAANMKNDDGIKIIAGEKLDVCPLCKSPAVEHPAEGLCVAGASCSNGDCILHRDYQDETNRGVRREQWPKVR